MQLTDKIGNTHVEAMKNILDFITSFNVHRLLYAISEKHLDEETIDSFTLDIREQGVKLERQKQFLFNYTKSCNKEYVLPNNKLVDTSGRLMHRMRSGIKGIKDMARAFCKTSRRRLPQGTEAPKTIERTLIAQEAYMKDLFGLDSYPDCVRVLFMEIANFYNNMNECLQEARRSLSEEKDIRKDKRRCLELLAEACEKCRHYQNFLIETIKSDSGVKASLQQTKSLQPNDENPVLRDWAKSEISEEGKGSFASNYYHNCSLDDVNKITYYRTITEAEGDANLVVCMTIFNCGQEKATKINQAISQFDKLLPPKCKKGRIPSIHLFVFMRWCSDMIGYETFLNYFNRRYKEAGGQWDVISKSALSGASRECSHETEKFKKAKSYVLSRLENIFSQNQLQQTA